jgi:cell division septation protein DedD
VPDTFQPVANPGALERRSHPRERVLYSSMKLENDNAGIILDISESGLAMQMVRSLPDDSLPHMRFQLSQSETWVEVQGRIAWMNDSKTRAGVEFIELPDEGRTLINNWISSIAGPSTAAEGNSSVEENALHPAPAVLEPVSEVPIPATKATIEAAERAKADSVAKDPIKIPSNAAEIRDVEPTAQSSRTRPEPAVTGNVRRKIPSSLYLPYEETIPASGETVGTRKPGQLIWIAVLTMLLASTLLFLAFHLRIIGNSRNDLPSDSSLKAKSPSVETERLRARPGFVIQVSALTHERDAIVFAETLRQMNFPAFVWRRKTDHLYRVVVGPYSDANSALRDKKELKKQGFDVIGMPWNP